MRWRRNFDCCSKKFNQNGQETKSRRRTIDDEAFGDVHCFPALKLTTEQRVRVVTNLKSELTYNGQNAISGGREERRNQGQEQRTKVPPP